MTGIDDRIIRKDYIMKTYLTFTLLIIATISVLIVSCTGVEVSGTYKCEDRYPMIDGKVNKIVFDGDKCTVVEGSLAYDNLDWKIENGKLKITGYTDFIFSSIEIDYEYEYTKDGNSIFLDGVEFIKQ